MKRTVYPLEVYRGDGYQWRFRLWLDEGKTDPVNLDGVTVRSEIRERSQGKIIVPLECTVEPPNVIVIQLLPANSAKLPPPTCFWDLRLSYPTGQVRTVLTGQVAVAADVTNSTPLRPEPVDAAGSVVAPFERSTRFIRFGLR